MEIYRILSYLITDIFIVSVILLLSILRHSVKKSAVIGFFALIIMFLCDYILFFHCNEGGTAYFVNTIVKMIFMQIFSFYISKLRDGRAAFTGFFVYSLISTQNTIGIFLNVVWIESFLILTLIYVIIGVLFILACIFVIRKQYLRLLQRNMRGWNSLCLIPTMFYFCFYFLTYFPRSLYFSPENLPAAIVLLFSMIIFYIVIFNFINKEIKREDIFWKNKIFEFYIMGFKTQYESVQKSEKELKIVRHDLRHFIHMMNTLLEQKEYDKVKLILEDIQKTSDNTIIKKYCDNIMINNIISTYMIKAEESGIKFDSDVIIPEEISLNIIQLGSVFANLTENAVYSAKHVKKGDKFVHIFSRYTKDHLIIEIKNSYVGKVLFDSDTHLPISSKGEGHGLGIQSVEAFVNETNSNFDCYCENNIFTVRVLVNIKEQEVMSNTGIDL